MRSKTYHFSILFIFIISACSLQNNKLKPVEIKEIKLKGEASKREAELSGLTWFGDELVLLPQYPFNFGNNTTGKLYKIHKSRLETFINEIDTTAIEPQEINIVGEGLEKFNVMGQGYEAITFVDGNVFLTIEAEENYNNSGYIIKGNINEDGTEIILDKNSLQKIPTRVNIHNISDEAIISYNNSLYSFYEANGKNVNINPVVHKYDLELKNISEVRFQNVEYRITDAENPDSSGKFWVINYMFPGDWQDLNPVFENATESNLENTPRVIERLLELRIKNDSIFRTETPPLEIKLMDNNEGRNWEGLVKLENKGFLLVTDYFPRTILAYLEYKVN